MPKRSLLLQVGTALALVLVLAGCTKGGQFDPTTIFDNDAFDSKKKIKGEREALFPNGVPGTTTGVPPDLVKGYQPPPDQPDADAAVPAPAPPQATAEAKPKPKPKPKPKVASAPAQKQDSIWNQKPAHPTRITVGAKPSAPSQQGAAQAQGQTPWPAPPQTSSNQQTVWPAPPPTAPAQQTAQPSQSVWPNPPPSR